jgi:hypothetical protein
MKRSIFLLLLSSLALFGSVKAQNVDVIFLNANCEQDRIEAFYIMDTSYNYAVWMEKYTGVTWEYVSGSQQLKQSWETSYTYLFPDTIPDSTYRIMFKNLCTWQDFILDTVSVNCENMGIVIEDYEVMDIKRLDYYNLSGQYISGSLPDQPGLYFEVTTFINNEQTARKINISR